MFCQKSYRKGNRGAVIVVVAIVMIVLLGIAALAVDIGYVAVTKNELQNIADAAALAGARELSRQYPEDYVAQQAFIADRTLVLAIIQDVASKNRAANMAISINPADVVIGRWDLATSTMSAENLLQPTAVSVVARRDETANTAINTFFARVLGVETVPVRADATAALSGQGSAAPGEVLVSSTVKDLVAGSGLRFRDRGTHGLHGVPGEWRLVAGEW